MAKPNKSDMSGSGAQSAAMPVGRDGQGEPIASETGLDSGQWVVRPYLCLTGRQFDVMRQGFWPVPRIGTLKSGQRYIRIDIEDLAKDLGVTPEVLLTHNRNGTLSLKATILDKRDPMSALELTFEIDGRKTQCRIVPGPQRH